MNQQTQNVLELLHKNASMGVYSLEALMPKASNENLRDCMKEQLDYYSHKQTRLESKFPEMLKKEKASDMLGKAFAGADIRFKTMLSSEPSKISELLIDGTNMGIVELEKLQNANTDIPESLKNEIESVISHEQKYLEKLREYL